METLSSASGDNRTALVFDMDPLYRQAIIQGLFGILLFVVLIFWPAGTLDYWQGWLFLGIFAAATVGFTLYLAIYDRPLLERRLKAGPRKHARCSRHSNGARATSTSRRIRWLSCMWAWASRKRHCAAWSGRSRCAPSI